MCRLRNIAKRDYQKSVTTGQTDTQIDRRRTKGSLCAAMLCRQHNKSEEKLLSRDYKTLQNSTL